MTGKMNVPPAYPMNAQQVLDFCDTLAMTATEIQADLIAGKDYPREKMIEVLGAVCQMAQSFATPMRMVVRAMEAAKS